MFNLCRIVELRKQAVQGAQTGVLNFSLTASEVNDLLDALVDYQVRRGWLTDTTAEAKPLTSV